ncbi:MAG: small multi-drug export protein [Endomicrobiia bacterium]
MLENIVNYLSTLPKELNVIIISLLPIAELRGAIPVAITMYNFSIIKSFILSVVGNFLFVAPFVWFLNYLSHHFMKYKWFNKIFTWWFNRVKAKSKSIEELEFWGLVIFVGIPLPMTGAWSGCVASYLLGIKPAKSILAILLGIFLAGIIVTIATVSVRQAIKLF